MVSPQDTTAQQIYDSENEGAWTGQLPNPDLVDQLPPPVKEHSLPDLDNTVKTLFYWAMDLDIPHGPRLALLTILRHIDWKEGDHCIAGIQTLARESQFSKKTLKGHLKYLVDAKLISRLRHVGRITETRLGTVGVETTPIVGVETTPIVGVAPTPETNSSSTNLINQKVPGVVDAKKVDHVDHPGPEPGVTTGVKPSSFEEEGVTGTEVTTGPGVTVQVAQASLDRYLSEIPTDLEIESVGKHCWPAWSKHWSGGWAAASATWTKNTASRRKFRKDVVAQLQKVGLPQPLPPDPENDRARERAAAWLDQRLEEAHKRMVDVKCAGCGFPRQLKPGEIHCYACRNLSEAPKLASLPGPAIWKTDEYEKVIEDNIRRYQEADGLAPGDPKVEAVGAALDAG